MSYRIAFILALAVCLRIPPLFSELWLDEVWWLNLVKQANSPFEIVTALTDVGNHLLYTFYLYAFRNVESEVLLRLPSFICGILSVLLISQLTQEKGGILALVPATLFACSSFFTLYATEARGYAVMVFLALLALYLLERLQRTASRALEYLLSAVLILGMLAQLIFVLWIVALLIYSAYLGATNGRGKRGALSYLLPFTLPMLFSILLYICFIRNLSSTSGSQSAYLPALLETVSVGLSGQTLTPSNSSMIPLVLFLALTVLLVVVFEIRTLYAERNPRWILYLATMTLFPAAAFVLAQGSPLYPRYFCLALAILYLLIGGFLQRASKQRIANLLRAIFIVIFLSGNGVTLFQMARYGRGDYAAALRYISAHSAQQVVTISGDHPVRHPLLIRYYQREAPQKEFVYVADGDMKSSASPHWYFLHYEDPGWTPPASVTSAFGNYRFDSVYRYSGFLSGWNLGVYKAQLRDADLSPEQILPGS